MKHVIWVLLFVVALAGSSWAGVVTGCYDQPGQTLSCWLVEDPGFDALAPEPTVSATNHFGDWVLGYYAIMEPDRVTISDYVVFPTPDTVVLYSADYLGQFPAGLNLTNLQLLGTFLESPPEPCWDCVVTFDFANNTGQFIDTMNVVSDPTPEPVTWALLGSGLVLLGTLRRKRN